MVTALSPLAQAVLEAVDDALLVLDPSGRVVYANGAGQAVLREEGAGTASPDAHGLLPRLGRRGARVTPLWMNGTKLGEAVFVPAAGESSRSTGARTLADREREAILETLQATGWKLTESARRLGISRTTLWRRLNAYGISRER